MNFLQNASTANLEGWTGSQAQKCFHQLFEHQANLVPTKIAIRCGGESLTYAELNAAADRVATQLSAMGIGPEVLVGLYTERSLVMVIGLLGILKSGGAYLPLDSQYPAQRLEFMLAETEAPVVLCEHTLRDRLPQLPPSSQVVSVAFDTDKQSDRLTLEVANDAIAEPNRDRPALNQAPSPQFNSIQTASDDSLAYIIYTSGSTGRPKGVMISQRNLADYCWAIAQPTGLTAADIYLHIGSISFATSARQLIMPLSHGATVVVTTDEERQSPLKALQLAKAERVTIMDMVPSYWRVLNAMLKQLDAPARQELLANDLRYVNGHGEAFSRYIPHTWREEFQHPASILNLYGQAEATGVVTVHPYQSDAASNVVPIGKPIPGAQIYVLDDDLQPAVPGVCGEIYVSGFGIAQGYFKRPKQTANRFLSGDQIPLALRKINADVKNANQSKQTFYKTGDMGRIRPDGVFEMLGRVDRQIKINGIRLEIDEVEAVITQHPCVREVAVLAQKTNVGDVYLAAYITLEAEFVSSVESRQSTHSQIVNQLKTDLESQLASYMIPARFSILETLPLTPNGKADRNALKNLNLETVSTVEFVAPRNEIERTLAKIWTKILRLPSVGIYDDFFELGGHSLLAAQMAARIETTFNCPMSLARFFQTPTIAEQARLLSHDSAGDGSPDNSVHWASLIPLEPGSHTTEKSIHKPAIFCVHGGGGSALMYRSLARRVGDDIALYGLQSAFLNDPQQLSHSIEEMADLYLQELRSVQPNGPYLIAGYCGGAPVALEIAQRLRADQQIVALLALFDPTSIQTYCTPSIDRYQRTLGAKIQSFNTRVERHGLRAVLKDYWIKLKIKRYEQQEKSLPIELRVVKVGETNARAVQRYVAQAAYPDPIAVYIPEKSITPDRKLADGWRAIATGEFNIYNVTGNHHFDGATAGSFFHEPNVQTLASQLKESIEEALEV